MFEIQVHHEQKMLVIPDQLICDALQMTFNSERILECQVNVILLDNQQIHEFNRRFFLYSKTPLSKCNI
jgi:ssRNA-specific RNase YbeY (16S rRNA maturation enzyme)